MSETLRMWTIYFNPSDHPGRWVVRGWSVGQATVPDVGCAVVATLDDARAIVPPGLACIPRDLGDDPSIVESWL